MRLGLVLDYSDDFAPAVDLVREAERVGADLVQVAEAYSFDAVSRLGYLAAVTSRVRLGSAILSVYTRTASALAMTAAGLDDVSGGRFELGIGASGPQVVEGFHGVPFTAPLTRVTETVEVCRAVWRRERVSFAGRQVQVPLPAGRGTGLGKPIALVNHPRRSRIPVSIAALTPRSVARTAEIAEGWMPAFWWPERAEEAFGAALAEGRATRAPELGPLDVQVSVPLLIGSGPVVAQALAAHRRRLALYLGGMGARGANFYADLAARYGYAEQAEQVQDRYLAGDRDGAAGAVPDELVAGTALIGDVAHVAERLSAYAASGVTTLSVHPSAADLAGKVADLEVLRRMLDA
ncbi:LLM class F420-dependent oxidoreductase [Actinotalea sp. M2MS4P-6]|uniref:LLM class F420-dependent oxidoreductase n=1 Tax=Actinotalea sp. M2MS4P-6 TaxID=2983762 RepID=UPI0021E45129|nr:LLM class F420-dependent oxidoreductase [Actinotalea sp. M2MS4P-6]MCV2394270.1 LLM class F420-dependent oxidoreductase [Actinotalea sp. M2MS4P-6]